MLPLTKRGASDERRIVAHDQFFQSSKALQGGIRRPAALWFLLNGMCYGK
jgi:hypothetical protein